MKTRAITAFFFVAVMLASLLLGAYAFTVFFLLLSLLSTEEFYKLVRADGLKPHSIWGWILVISIYVPAQFIFSARCTSRSASHLCSIFCIGNNRRALPGSEKSISQYCVYYIRSDYLRQFPFVFSMPLVLPKANIHGIYPLLF
jgi:CDP-diglyceride synthetase